MFYTAREAAEKLGVSRSWVYTLVKMRELVPIRYNPLLFAQEEIDNYKGERLVRVQSAQEK